MLDKITRLLGWNCKVEIDPPDIVSKCRGRIGVVRYLISEEVNYGLESSSIDKLKILIDKYAMLLDRLPPSSEIRIVKLKTDLGKILSRITNEMLNLKALIDTVEETHVKKKAETRLRILEKLYETIINGKPITRVVIVVKIYSHGRSLEEARREVKTLASITKTLFYTMINVKLRECDNKTLRKLLSYELGISSETGSKGIVVETNKLSLLVPAPPYKKPMYEKENRSIPIGYDIETGWPVLIPLNNMNKHILIIGPTGRGKTTFLASLIESLASLNDAVITAIDFKGDLASIVSRDIINTITPSDLPLNILVKPSGISDIDWILLVADALESTLGLNRGRIVEVLSKYMGSIPEDKVVISDQSLSILSPIVKLLIDKPRYDKLLSYFNDNVLFDLSSHGTAYQNVYGALIVNIYRETIVKKKDLRINDKLHVLIIDEAWRIIKLQGLLEIVKEGRSRGVGVVLAVQNPSDIPQEIIENTHLLVIFGSPNEDYHRQASRILGLPLNITSKLSYLGVGEALLLNALDPHPVVIKINKPLTL